MASNVESFITVYNDISWRGDSYSSPLPIHVDNEKFSFGQEFAERENKARQGRAYISNVTTAEARKPTAEITYQPRTDDIAYFLFPHFQMGIRTGSDPDVFEFVPSKSPPEYGYDIWKGYGTYGDPPGEVYSSSFLKKYFTTDSEIDSLLFRHGICDSLTFSASAGEDLLIKSSWRFKSVGTGTRVNSVPNGYISGGNFYSIGAHEYIGGGGAAVDAGTYSTQSPFTFFEGTLNIGPHSFDILNLDVTSKNNILEKVITGEKNPDCFPFRDYQITGQFVIDLPSDGLEQIGSMVDVDNFAITGTWYKDSSNYIVFDIPYCERRNFDVGIGNRNIDATIPFKAFENDGTHPIKITVSSGDVIPFAQGMYDAGYGARTIADYELLDAGYGARTIGDYELIDRDN